MIHTELTSDYGRGAGRLLLLDADRRHADTLIARLLSHNLHVDAYADPQQAIAQLRGRSSEYEVVIINVSSRSVPWLTILHKLDQACRRSVAGQARPFFLCLSTNQQQPEFVLQIERNGARYVRER
jgi:hypothetical protein